MEILANIILGSGIVALTIAIIVLARSIASVAPTLVAYGRELASGIKNQVAAENERDEWKTQATKLRAELNLTNAKLARTAAELARSLKEDEEDHVEEIRTAPGPAAALDKLNELLQDVPNVPSNSDSGTSGG